MMVYSTKEKKTSIMQASSQTSMAVTALETGIRALEIGGLDCVCGNEGWVEVMG